MLTAMLLGAVLCIPPVKGGSVEASRLNGAAYDMQVWVNPDVELDRHGVLTWKWTDEKSKKQSARGRLIGMKGGKVLVETATDKPPLQLWPTRLDPKVKAWVTEELKKREKEKAKTQPLPASPR